MTSRIRHAQKRTMTNCRGSRTGSTPANSVKMKAILVILMLCLSAVFCNHDGDIEEISEADLACFTRQGGLIFDEIDTNCGNVSIDMLLELDVSLQNQSL